MVDCVVDDVVGTDLYLFLFREAACIQVRADPEPDDNRPGCRCKDDIRFRDHADAAVDNAELDLFVLDLHERI